MILLEYPFAVERKLHSCALECQDRKQCHPILPTQVADDCSMLPLALSMAGAMAKDQPLDASSWRTLHETLQEKDFKLEEMRPEEMTSQNKSIFSTIHASVDILPRTVREQLRLMVVMASGVAADLEMLASLWDVVRNYQFLLLIAWCLGLDTSPLGLFCSIIGVLSLIILLFAFLSYRRTVNNLGGSSKLEGNV